jgi:hypothetical protein
VTDYESFKTASQDYAVEFQFFWEPYMVLSMRRAPLWDERFVYYGFDKVVYSYVLDKLDYHFTVLADHFIVHLPHPRDPWYEDSGRKASDAGKSLPTDVERRLSRAPRSHLFRTIERLGRSSV